MRLKDVVRHILFIASIDIHNLLYFRKKKTRNKKGYISVSFDFYSPLSIAAILALCFSSSALLARTKCPGTISTSVGFSCE